MLVYTKYSEGISFRLGRSKRVMSWVTNDRRERIIPERRNSRCRGTETGKNLVWSRNLVGQCPSRSHDEVQLWADMLSGVLRCLED